MKRDSDAMGAANRNGGANPSNDPATGILRKMARRELPRLEEKKAGFEGGKEARPDNIARRLLQMNFRAAARLRRWRDVFIGAPPLS